MVKAMSYPDPDQQWADFKAFWLYIILWVPNFSVPLVMAFLMGWAFWGLEWFSVESFTKILDIPSGHLWHYGVVLGAGIGLLYLVVKALSELARRL